MIINRSGRERTEQRTRDRNGMGSGRGLHRRDDERKGSMPKGGGRGEKLDFAIWCREGRFIKTRRFGDEDNPIDD